MTDVTGMSTKNRWLQVTPSLTSLWSGVPGDVITAIIIGAFMIHGLQPGPIMFIQNETMIFQEEIMTKFRNPLKLVQTEITKILKTIRDFRQDHVRESIVIERMMEQERQKTNTQRQQLLEQQTNHTHNLESWQSQLIQIQNQIQHLRKQQRHQLLTNPSKENPRLSSWRLCLALWKNIIWMALII